MAVAEEEGVRESGARRRRLFGGLPVGMMSGSKDDDDDAAATATAAATPFAATAAVAIVAAIATAARAVELRVSRLTAAAFLVRVVSIAERIDIGDTISSSSSIGVGARSEEAIPAVVAVVGASVTGDVDGTLGATASDAPPGATSTPCTAGTPGTANAPDIPSATIPPPSFPFSFSIAVFVENASVATRSAVGLTSAAGCGRMDASATAAATAAATAPNAAADTAGSSVAAALHCTSSAGSDNAATAPPGIHGDTVGIFVGTEEP